MPGLDKTVLSAIDWQSVLQRVRRDTETDLIFAPHFKAIFAHAEEQLSEHAQGVLRSGKYQPELPLTMSIPKRWGFTRPGSILNPIDRVIYHAVGEAVAPHIEKSLDRSRVFSHVWQPPTEGEALFLPEGQCWSRLRQRITSLGRKGGCFLKIDISNYFERIPQHNLINLLRATGCDGPIVNFLEEMLLAFRERNSFGIVQGLFTSDLLGNFYLTGVDSDFDLESLPSARFVDDIYVHYKNKEAAARGLIRLIEALRREGLHVNESKSGIYPATTILEEENELEQLFSAAAKEVKEEASKMEFVYGFAGEGRLEDDGTPSKTSDAEDENDAEIVVASVLNLLKSAGRFKAKVEKIDRFCIPVLQAAKSDAAIDRALRGVIKRPHLARMYLSYLATFADKRLIRHKLEELILSDSLVFDYQLMYALAAALQCRRISKPVIDRALQILTKGSVAQECRAVAAILAAKLGSAQQRRHVRLAYEGETSSYVRAAILYASAYFTAAERSTCKKAWGGHSLTNSLIAASI
jgi:hypothetical protein